MRIEATCGLCKRIQSDCLRIKIIDNFKKEPQHEFVCLNCRKTKKFYFVEFGFVKYNHPLSVSYTSVLEPS